MFENGFMPENFNLGRITPILKDTNKSNKMINNIRPITVSDVISNIFEKYLLYRVNEQIKDKKE